MKKRIDITLTKIFYPLIFIYNLSLHTYRFIIGLFSFVNPKAKLWISGRKNWKERLQEKIDPSASYYWVHCASLGEFEQGRPLIEKIKKDIPESNILISFFSPSGFEIRKNYEQADVVCYLPLDTKENANEFIDLINPRMAIFIKYDLWYHYLEVLNKNRIPSYLVSAHFIKTQSYFKPLVGEFFRSILSSLHHIFVQDMDSKDLLATYEINNVTVSGDTRFDRVIENFQDKRQFPELEYINSSGCLVAGSTWSEDIDLLEKFWDSRDSLLDHLIIAPHEIHRETSFNNSILYSQLNEARTPSNSVLILDNIGMLSSIYGKGKYAYIGGGFGSGIHNILEAAVFGSPLFFGPNYLRFKEANELIERGGAFSINSAVELLNKIQFLEDNPDEYQKIKEINTTYINEKKGATELILRQIIT